MDMSMNIMQLVINITCNNNCEKKETCFPSIQDFTFSRFLIEYMNQSDMNAIIFTDVSTNDSFKYI